jgi:hypothetical protein
VQKFQTVTNTLAYYTRVFGITFLLHMPQWQLEHVDKLDHSDIDIFLLKWSL